MFLISLKAGGFGLNLTAASYVVLFDPWWNPAVETQAIDRTHRIGQTSKVIAYRLLIQDSIEQKIRALQKQKARWRTTCWARKVRPEPHAGRPALPVCRLTLAFAIQPSLASSWRSAYCVGVWQARR